MGEPTIQRAGAALALVGVGIATYITIADAGGGAPVCVAGGHGCQTVADSSYADLGGVAVSVIGIGGYIALLVAMLWPATSAGSPPRHWRWSASASAFISPISSSV